jgi:hypothetical protein
MPDQEIINEMIGVYRDLNLKLRGLDLDRFAGKKNEKGETLVDVLRRMRNREYNSSQAIKLMSLGDERGRIREATEATVLDELVATGITPIILLSQFGTAREATLSLVRTMADEDWDTQHTTPRGEMSIREYLRAIVNDDHEDVRSIDQLVAQAPV